MSIWGHLTELRSRLIKAIAAILIGLVLALAFLERWAFQLAIAPLGNRKLMFLGLGEAFSTHLSFALAIGFLLALPVVAFQVWAFVAPGLYPKERRASLRFAVVSTMLFACGVLFVYTLLMPVIVRFFLSFEEPQLEYGGAMGAYLRLFTGILIGSGIAFQFPLIIIALLKSGLVNLHQMREKRGYWIIGIFVAAALLTPTGDVVTQMLLAVPLWLLFETALIYSSLTSQHPPNPIEP